jgi:hypothetical protein
MAGIFDLIAGNGQSGGLLDFLRQNADAAIRNQSNGVPGDTANYDTPAPAPQSLVQAATAPAATPDNSAIQDALWKAKQAAAAAPAPAAPVADPMAAPAPAAPVAAPAAGPPAGLTSGPSIFAPRTTNAFGQSQAGPISSGLQTFAHALSNVTNGGMDSPEVMAQKEKDAAKATATAQQNQTAAALAKRGVDADLANVAVLPGNTDLLKTLISDKFGPAKAPTSLGQGYIWNPQTEKVEKAYETEGKIPVGFQKTPDGKGMEFIPGGPADPKYIAAQVASKGEGKMAPGTLIKTKAGDEMVKIDENGVPQVVYKNKEGAALSDETADSIAAQWLSGNHEVTKNLPKSAVVQVRESVTRQAKAAGMNVDDINDAFNEQIATKSAMRTAAEMGAKTNVKATEAAKLLPIAEDAFNALPNGSWVPVNKLRNAYESNAGSPEQKAAGAAIQSFVNVYVNAISNGQPTDAMREHAYHILDKSDSPAAFLAATRVLKKELEAAQEGPKEAIHSMSKGSGARINNPAPGSPDAAKSGSPAAAVPKSAPGTYSVPGHGTFTVEKVEQ